MNKKAITSLLIGAGILTAGMAVNDSPVKADTAISSPGIVTTNAVTHLYNNQGKLITNRALAANTPWVTDKLVKLDSVGNAYRVSTDEFVKASDVSFQHGNADNGVVKVGNNNAIGYTFENGQYVANSNQLISAGSAWKYNYTDKSSGKTWYQIATNLWVNSDDVSENNGVNVNNTGKVVISYAPNSGIDVYTGYGSNKVATGQKLPNGSGWKFSQKAIDLNGNAWYEVGDNQWIDGAYTKVSNDSFDQAAAQVWDPNYAAVKVNQDTPVYWDSNFSTATEQKYYAGKLVQVVSTVLTGDTIWYEISSGGWLPSTAVSEVSVSREPVSLNGQAKDQVIEQIVSVAKQQLGKPYVWNGKGPDNFDCSGLMQYVFRQVTGQNIGAWTVPQETAGTRVSIDQLQRGDLVFWGNPGASYHVGLYLGDNQYLNALRPGTNVKIDAISTSFEPSFGVRIFN